MQPMCLLCEEAVSYLNGGTWDLGAGTVAKDQPTGGSAASVSARSVWLCTVVCAGMLQ